MTDASGGSWTVGAPADAGSSRGYVASVLGALPEDYWRLADTGTTTAVNQFKSGTATYSNVTQGVSGGPFADTTVDGFNGSSSYLALPNALIGPGNQSVSLWFKTTAHQRGAAVVVGRPGHRRAPRRAPSRRTCTSARTGT